MYRLISTLTLGLLVVLVAGCDTSDTGSDAPDPLSGRYNFSALVLDIDATPDGSLFITENATIRRISTGGVEDVGTIPVMEGAPVNGVEAVDDRVFLATSGGLDLAAGAALWRGSSERVQRVADITAFETDQDPDVKGADWKDPACERDSTQGFSAGPQSNPYHVARLSERTTLVADGAGNSLLAADTDGTVDWVAVFTPPLDENGEWRFFRPAEETPEIDCYVQPVPTAVAVGPDGAYYVGELTGTPAVPGWSRVWRVAPGARNVLCPSEDCQVVLSGLTSVIDVAFGPDDRLYVVEIDQNGWLGAVIGQGLGGTIRRCDVDAGTCDLVEAVDVPLTAITFDPSGQLWVAENENLLGTGTATVRRVPLP
jgi:hypothetical protein